MFEIQKNTDKGWVRSVHSNGITDERSAWKKYVKVLMPYMYLAANEEYRLVRRVPETIEVIAQASISL